MSLWTKRRCRPDPASPRAGVKKRKPSSPSITKYLERRPLAAVNSSVKKLGGLKEHLIGIARGSGPTQSVPVVHKGVVPIEEEWLVVATPTKEDEIQLTEVENDWQLVTDATTSDEKKRLREKLAMPKSSKSPGHASSLLVISPPQPPQSGSVIVIDNSPPPPNVLVDLMVPTPKRVCIDLTDDPLPTNPRHGGSLRKAQLGPPNARGELNVVQKRLAQKSPPLLPKEPSESSGLAESQPVPLTTGGTGFPRNKAVSCNKGYGKNSSRHRTQPPKLGLHASRRLGTFNSLFSPTVLCERVQILKVTSFTPPEESAPPAVSPASPLQAQDDSTIVSREKEGVAFDGTSSGPPAVARSSPTPPSMSARVHVTALVEEWRKRGEGDAGPVVSLENRLEMVLWERGVPYIKGHTQSRRVQLFTTTQNMVVENIMENGPSSLSLRLLSVVDCLSLSTSSRRLPKASLLHRLWEMIWDPHVVSNHVSQESLLGCLKYFHSLLLIHPPGKHGIVDAVYAEFVESLGPQVGAFAVWEEIDCLIRSSSRGHSAYMFAYLVDLLLSDYWVWLNRGSGSKRSPIFARVFWQDQSSSHITMPIRKLLDVAVHLLAQPRPNEMEHIVLDGVLCLLGVVLTRCPDLSMEVKVALGDRTSLIPLY